MGMNTGSGRLMSEINVTPFVDVMLVLLIIFMVTAPMMMEGVQVDLPKTTSKPLPAANENEQIIVSIDREGNIFINKESVKLGFLEKTLKLKLGSRSERAVYLKADREIQYGMVVRVMSEIKDAGVDKLGMVTIPEDRENNANSRKGK